jgi:hypothetical protein
MEKQANKQIQDVLIDMRAHCKEIRALLEKDKNYFHENNFASLNESNTKKIDIINQLNEMAAYLSRQKLLIENVTPLNPLVADIKAEIAHCYNHIMINTSVVFANMQQLKEICDKLTSCKQGLETVYDKTGNTVVK